MEQAKKRLFPFAMVLLILVVTSFIWLVPDKQPAIAYEQTLTINTDTTKNNFKIDVAATPGEQGRGLMERTDLADDYGMLFIFNPPRIVKMWMKNTPSSLDMIFISSDGTITGFAENTVPQSTDLITSKEPVAAILEVKAGTVHKLGIKQGNKVIHSYFSKKQ